MDEPLSSLDIKRKREILPHIETLPEIFGVPVLYVTHNVDEVARLANDVVLLVEGRVAAHGSVTEVFERTRFGGADGRARSRTSCCARRWRRTTTASRPCASERSNCACRWRRRKSARRGPYASTRATWRSRPCDRRNSAFATSSWAVSCSIEPGDQHERRAAARHRRRALTCENYPRRSRGARRSPSAAKCSRWSRASRSRARSAPSFTWTCT